MASRDSSEASDGTDASFTKILLTIQSLEDELAGAKEGAKRAISERDAGQANARRLEEELAACRSEMQKAVSELENDKQHWTAQAKAAESEKLESSNRAAALWLQLESLRSSRDKNYQATKEKQYKADLELELIRDECSRMQKQLRSYAGLLSALETELLKTREAVTDAKAMVSENCRLVSKQEEKLQKAIVGEERFLGKIKRQAAGFKALRARLQEKEQALKDLASAHETATKQLAASKTEAAELQRTVDILEAAEKEHISSRNTLHRSLQRSNELLVEARGASEQHRAALDTLREKYKGLNAEALERAATDAATVKQQGLELSALRCEVEKLRKELVEPSATRLQEPLIAVMKISEQKRAGHMRPAPHSQQTGSQSPLAAQSAAQHAVSVRVKGNRGTLELKAPHLQQSQQQIGRAAKIIGSDQKAGDAIAAHAEQQESDASVATASVLPAVCAPISMTSDHSTLDARSSVAASQIEGRPLQQHIGNIEPSGATAAPRQEAAAFMADTPDELDTDFDFDLPQRQQSAQPLFQGMLIGTDSSRNLQAVPRVSIGKECGSIPPAAQDRPRIDEASTPTAAAEAPADVKPVEDSQLHTSAAGVGHSTAESSAQPVTGSCSPCDLFASFTSLQDLSDDEQGVP